ncbi:hypothetical protein Q765_14595 [Flavobacterium rivuli WB 3.3-2 = DSM 21788]|uniref:Uncharacterized protein n=2 Tax=Flavobacterium rivuli TaxID=498301 RepID=A0A0A2M0P9_9FLAO|nr:hypothetical protein [Flavobacterium rivuli]KGO85849.1 hypothetical protein Q765_14595 [Flavobacterium rivuli WB 3.3-2 = DSM 21788]
MHKTLNAEQIEQLYTFTRQHFVEYYDLQTELVDHLANAIETLWEVKPQLTFDDALKTEFKKFGIYGFSDVVEERQKALGKKYTKLMARYFKEFFKLPRILLTIAMFVITYKLFKFFLPVYIPLILILEGFSFYRIIKLKKIYKVKTDATGKRWLLEEMIYRGGSAMAVAGMTIQFMQFALRDHLQEIFILLMALVFVLSLMHSYVVLYVIPAKATEHLSAAYPGYKWEKL